MCSFSLNGLSATAAVEETQGETESERAGLVVLSAARLMWRIETECREQQLLEPMRPPTIEMAAGRYKQWRRQGRIKASTGPAGCCAKMRIGPL